MTAFPQLEGALRTQGRSSLAASCLAATTLSKAALEHVRPGQRAALARLAGFEPATGCLEDRGAERCSNLRKPSPALNVVAQVIW